MTGIGQIVKKIGERPSGVVLMSKPIALAELRDALCRNSGVTEPLRSEAARVKIDIRFRNYWERTGTMTGSRKAGGIQS